MNVSFEYDEEIIEFDENGDPPGRYDIMNYHKLGDGTFDYVQVGNWNNRSLLWNNSQMLQFGRQGNIPPRSVCSEECPKGHYKVSGSLCSAKLFALKIPSADRIRWKYFHKCHRNTSSNITNRK